MQFSMYDSVFAHWEQDIISIHLFKFLMVKSFSILRLELWCNNFCLSLVETSLTNNKYLLIFKTSYSSESFSFWTFRKVNSTVVNGFDLGMACYLCLIGSCGYLTCFRFCYRSRSKARLSYVAIVMLNSLSQRKLVIAPAHAISLERRWSSHTFRYGYLVTTSPQLPTLP